MYSENFEKLKDECTLCRKCPLFEERLNIVFGQGNENADILLVSDAPRGKDDLKGIPFSDKDGEILDKFLLLCDLSREDIFITDIVKCRPEGKEASDGEMDICIEHLRRQVRHIKPKIILCFGERASKKMIAPDFDLNKSHGQFIKKGKLYFMGTLHPEEALLNEECRLLMLEDFQKFRKGLEALK